MKYYRAAARTHRGRKRKNNQDNFFCNGEYKTDAREERYNCEMEISEDDRILLGVFDGMGGLQSGEKAALISCETVNSYKWETVEDIDLLVQEINHNICSESLRNGIIMGSTCVILADDGNGFRAWNIGDSRAYLFRDESLVQLSVDHNKSDHVLTQFLGIDEVEFLIEPYRSQLIKPQNGDVLILCSDGLYRLVDEDSMINILKETKDIAAACEKFENAALSRGGNDNITVLALKVYEH